MRCRLNDLASFDLNFIVILQFKTSVPEKHPALQCCEIHKILLVPGSSHFKKFACLIVTAGNKRSLMDQGFDERKFYLTCDGKIAIFFTQSCNENLARSARCTTNHTKPEAYNPSAQNLMPLLPYYVLKSEQYATYIIETNRR